MLRWVRKSIGYSLREVAKKLRRPEEELRLWENGDSQPSIPQARRLADLYRRTLAWFYLSEPPEEAALPPDYRTTRAGEARPHLTPAIQWRIRQLHSLREAALDLSEDDPSAFPPFPVRASPDRTPDAVAASLRKELGVSIETQLGWASPTAALRKWRHAIEYRLHCLVFLLDRLKADDLDGLSLAFDRAPVIALNANSELSDGRKVFTLMHELAHIAMRSQGVCNLSDRASNTETVCNQTAAALLMPAGSFASRAARPAPASSTRLEAWSEGRLLALANAFGVSRQAVYVRLVTLNLAKRTDYEAWIADRDRDRTTTDLGKAKERESKPSFYNIYLHRMSSPYLRQVFASYHDDRITLRDLSDYLGVKPNTALALDERFRKRSRHTS